MWKKETKRNLTIFVKAGLPFTVIGMIVVFLGLYLLKLFFADSEYLMVILFLWLALFWFIYQPMFRSRIRKVAEKLEKPGIKNLDKKRGKHESERKIS